MRKLSAKDKAFAAEKLGIAHAHQKVAETLHANGHHGAAITRAYYSALFSSQAALANLGSKATTHKYWITSFNKRFGKGTSWIPKLYVKTLNELQVLRDTYDYHGALPDNHSQAQSLLSRTANLLKKVINNTPLLYYPEFLENILDDYEGILALEFDYYCPKSYIHKERVQFQIQARMYDRSYCKKIEKAGRQSITTIHASKKGDYVLGWNNRLGQSADAFILFLDIDNNDEATVKAALKGRKGWLFKSGEGFHFVGSEVYTSRKQWEYRFKQAANSRKLKSLADSDHVDFSIRRGYSTLRISTSPIKPFRPFQCLDQS